jgi:hypothetical protein
MTQEAAMKVAAANTSKAVETVGAYEWSRQGRETDMLTSIRKANPGKDDYVDKGMLADALNSLITETHKKNSPGTLAGVQIIMAPDSEDGKQNLIVTMRNDDGTYLMPVYMDSAMLFNQVKARELKKAAATEKTDQGTGPKITHTPADGVPSIYERDPEVWKKYRERNATRK